MPRHEEHRITLGSEHPLCDSVQMALLLLFLLVWGIDTVAHFLFGLSSVLVDFLGFLPLLVPSALSFGVAAYLGNGSHNAIFDETLQEAKLIDTGVYSKVRHPMYLAVLLFCLGFLFVSISFLSFVIWIAFFIFFDRMASYEEDDLIRVIGDEYLEYQRRVPRWLPRI